VIDDLPIMLCCTANNYCDQICKRCLFSHTKFLNFETSYVSNHCIYPCNYLSFSMRKAMELGYVLTQNVTYSLSAMVFVYPRVKCGEDAKDEIWFTIDYQLHNKQIYSPTISLSCLCPSICQLLDPLLLCT